MIVPWRTGSTDFNNCGLLFNQFSRYMVPELYLMSIYIWGLWYRYLYVPYDGLITRFYCNLLNILLLRHDVSSTFRIANNYSYCGSSSYLHTVTVLAPNGWEIILPNDCRKVRLAHLSDTHLCLDPLTPWGPLNIVRGHHHLRGALQHIATFKIAKLQSSNPAFLPY